MSFIKQKKAMIKDWEVAKIASLLREADGNVTKAAKLAKMDRSNFLRLMAKYSIKSKNFRKGKPKQDMRKNTELSYISTLDNDRFPCY